MDHEPPPRLKRPVRRVVRACVHLLGHAVAALALVSGALGSADAAEDCPPAAQAPSPEQWQTLAQTARDRGFLWRLRKNGHSSYLYGTVHIAKPEWMVPGTTVMDALRSSDVIALELDMLDPATMERLRAGMALRPDRVLSMPLADRLRSQVRAACLPESLPGVIAPEMVAATLVALAARREGLDPGYAIDMALAGLGRGLKKPVLALETPELQLALLLGRNAQETQAMVEQMLDELESRRVVPMLTRIAQLWAEGRFDELERYGEWCDCLDSALERKLHKRLLADRNPELADHIDALHRRGKQVFAAVGSLHMIGPLGLPALLAQRGYQVERIQFKP